MVLQWCGMVDAGFWAGVQLTSGGLQVNVGPHAATTAAPAAGYETACVKVP